MPAEASGSPAPEGKIGVNGFHSVFDIWCEAEGHALYQAPTVRSIMVEKGIDTGKSVGLSVWRGIAWSADARSLVYDATGQEIDAQAAGPPPHPAPF